MKTQNYSPDQYVALECCKMMLGLVGKNQLTGTDDRYRWLPGTHEIHTRTCKDLVSWDHVKDYLRAFQSLMCRSIVLTEGVAASDMKTWTLWAKSPPGLGDPDACQPSIDIDCLIQQLDTLIQRAPPKRKSCG